MARPTRVPTILERRQEKECKSGQMAHSMKVCGKRMNSMGTALTNGPTAGVTKVNGQKVWQTAMEAFIMKKDKHTEGTSKIILRMALESTLGLTVKNMQACGRTENNMEKEL